MSETRTIWHDLSERRTRANHGRIVDYILAATILVTMTVIEVQFLRFVAGPDSVTLIQSADGFVVPEQINTSAP